MKKKQTLILIAVFAIILIGASVLYKTLSKDAAPDQLAVQEDNSDTQTGSSDTSAGTQETDPSSDNSEQKVQAPDFTVYDIDGNPVRLSDYKGTPVVLNFWASWCGPCKSEMPEFQTKQKELDGKVQFLMVNMTDGVRETVEAASAYLEEANLTLPVFFDTDFQASDTYSVFSLPTSYFIDEEGYIIANATGAIDGETLQRGIDMIYKE